MQSIVQSSRAVQCLPRDPDECVLCWKKGKFFILLYTLVWGKSIKIFSPILSNHVGFEPGLYPWSSNWHRADSIFFFRKKKLCWFGIKQNYVWNNNIKIKVIHMFTKNIIFLKHVIKHLSCFQKLVLTLKSLILF